ncbi:hypothetical protein [Nocardia mangyaensis]|uniref:hypothetical protein n=1 Tax=Nocardia mangyaensis TaxID=2213200 RepID=UPI002674E70A|nr:hypothetical protein [Nocardia mangyaensis]MDO3645622.1 hypothetical protein [Nocardia mangyaensis]
MTCSRCSGWTAGPLDGALVARHFGFVLSKVVVVLVRWVLHVLCGDQGRVIAGDDIVDRCCAYPVHAAAARERLRGRAARGEVVLTLA